MPRVKDLHRKWMKNEKYRKAHAELAAEFALARAVIARLESGRTRPSTHTLERLAAAVALPAG